MSRSVSSAAVQTEKGAKYFSSRRVSGVMRPLHNPHLLVTPHHWSNHKLRCCAPPQGNVTPFWHVTDLRLATPMPLVTPSTDDRCHPLTCHPPLCHPMTCFPPPHLYVTPSDLSPPLRGAQQQQRRTLAFVAKSLVCYPELVFCTNSLYQEHDPNSTGSKANMSRFHSTVTDVNKNLT